MSVTVLFKTIPAKEYCSNKQVKGIHFTNDLLSDGPNIKIKEVEISYEEKIFILPN
jgi:hypothetical protein